MSLRDYQQEAVDWLSETRRGIVKCPAGGGKTRIAATAIDWVARSVQRDRQANVTWLANTNEQVDQAKEALAMFPAISNLCRLRVACWQSGIDCSEEDLVVVDECHHAGAPTLAAMVSTAPNARWGLSATPLGMDPEKNLVMLALFDFKQFEVKRERIVDGGHLTKAKVFLHSDTDAGISDIINEEVPKLLSEQMKKQPWLDEAEQRKRITWQLCQTLGIVQNSLRNKRITSICGGCTTDAILTLVGTVEHGQTLAREIPESVVCHSGMGAKKRRAAIAGFRDGSLRVMIATSMCDEGFDAPRASVLILARAGRSPGLVEQRTGRVLRLFEGKTHGIIHDFTDLQHPMLKAQSKSRQRTYRKLGYEIAS